MIPRRAQKVDANQEAIVKRLRSIGVHVEVIGEPVDLLLLHRGVVQLMEVKNRDGRNRLTTQQAQLIARGWPLHIAHDEEEAVRLVLGEKAMA